MKIIEKVAAVVFTLFVLWVLLSWVDVVAHNDPYANEQPHTWNCFVLMTEAVK